jgi:hypothetical protein
MRKVDRPIHTSRMTLLTCAEGMKDEDLKRRVKEAADQVASAAAAFDEAARAGSFYKLEKKAFELEGVNKGEMIWLYENRMVPRNSSGRPIYKDLLEAPRHRRCPLCGQRRVGTLDHYLPKTSFPALAVAPPNLIPCCYECNKAKTSTVPQTADQQTLHPYYDDVENEVWLHAKVLEVEPVSLVFHVDPPKEWETILRARIQRHFEVFRLAELYASHAAEQLSIDEYWLSKIYQSAGAQGVRDHLLGEVETNRAADLNSWQTATYAAVAASDWFCEGRFAVS